MYRIHDEAHKRPVLSDLAWWTGFELGLMFGPRTTNFLSGLLLSYLRVCFGLALVGIFPGPLGFGIMLVLVVWIDLLFGLGVWGGGLRLASVPACVLVANPEMLSDKSLSGSSIMPSRYRCCCGYSVVSFSHTRVSFSFISVIFFTASSASSTFFFPCYSLWCCLLAL